MQRPTKTPLTLTLSPVLATLCAAGASAQAHDRTVLPIAEPKRPVVTEVDAREVKASVSASRSLV